MGALRNTSTDRRHAARAVPLVGAASAASFFQAIRSPAKSSRLKPLPQGLEMDAPPGGYNPAIKQSHRSRP
jgi:hypothetical protein